MAARGKPQQKIVVVKGCQNSDSALNRGFDTLQGLGASIRADRERRIPCRERLRKELAAIAARLEREERAE
jgi:hypothetical protein